MSWFFADKSLTPKFWAKIENSSWKSLPKCPIWVLSITALSRSTGFLVIPTHHRYALRSIPPLGMIWRRWGSCMSNPDISYPKLVVYAVCTIKSMDELSYSLWFMAIWGTAPFSIFRQTLFWEVTHGSSTNKVLRTCMQLPKKVGQNMKCLGQLSWPKPMEMKYDR